MFSVSNPKEKLTYPVGLLTGEETNMFSGDGSTDRPYVVETNC